MTATTTPEISTVLPDLAQAARRRRRPSARNVKIYEQVHVNGIDQHFIATEHGISQPRISAICKQVQRWLSQNSPAERGEPEAVGRKRVERFLAKRRYQTLYAYSLRFLDRSQKELMTMTTHFGENGNEGTDQTIRAQRAEAQWMRMAMRATDRLWELGELEEPECETPAQVGSSCREEPELHATSAPPPGSAGPAEPTKCYAPEPDNSAAEAVVIEPVVVASDDQAATCDESVAAVAATNGAEDERAEFAEITVSPAATARQEPSPPEEPRPPGPGLVPARGRLADCQNDKRFVAAIPGLPRRRAKRTQVPVEMS